jgi:hypothetical protein
MPLQPEWRQSPANHLGERVHADGDQFVALNQSFADEARKLVEPGTRSARDIEITGNRSAVMTRP